jgi:ABC-type nitrate/sulfonate/bicarbonate transport system ATPase subunit
VPVPSAGPGPHDFDEAIYLADRIVLMTNGPGAAPAEIVENPLPAPHCAGIFNGIRSTTWCAITSSTFWSAAAGPSSRT